MTRAERRPSDVAQQRASGWYGRRAVSYCEELRNHSAEFVETRRRTLIALAVVAAFGIAVLATGRAAMAAWFGLTPGVILLIVLGGNELLVRRLDRRMTSDCADAPELLDLSDPRATPPRP